MRLPPPDLQLIRTQPQSTELFLSIFQPRIIFTAQVNDPSILQGEMNIGYDNVSGLYTDIESGFTLWVGTAPGLNDMGKVRVRSATASVLHVAENSHIEWADNLYLSVIKFVDIVPIYPRIINDPDDAENVIFFKDFNVVYANQNRFLGTMINMGSHRAAILEGGSANLFYTASGTSTLQTGIALNYDWTFEGGVPGTSAVPDPGWVNYSVPGHYVTRLITSGSNGAIDTSYRYVSIYNPLNSGTSLPYQRWEFDDLSGSRDEGGWTTSITIYESSQTVEEGAVVVIFSKDYFGNTQRSLGGNQENNSGIFFVGHVMDGSIEYDYEKSVVKFDVASVTGYMREMDGFSVSVESAKNPKHWYQLRDLDIKNAIYHYLKWHSTVMMTTDVRYEGTNPKVQYFDADRTSLFDAIDSWVRGTVVGKAVSDRQGKIWLEQDLTILPTGTIASYMDIGKSDYIGTPSIDERTMLDLSYLEMGGIRYSGAFTGTFQAMMACAPGGTPSYRGSVEKNQGLALESRAQLNQITRNLFEFKNFNIAQIDMGFAGSYRNLDIAPQEPLFLVINPEDNVRRLNVRRDFNLSSMTWAYDSENKSLMPRGVLIPWVNGLHVERIDIPDIPDDGGYSTPPSQVPNVPDLSFPAALGNLGISSIAQFEGSIVLSGGTPQFVVRNTDGNITLVGLADFHVSEPGWYAFHLNMGFAISTSGNHNAFFTLRNSLGDQLERQRWNFNNPATSAGSWGLPVAFTAVFRITDSSQYVNFGSSGFANGSEDETSWLTIMKIRNL